MSTSKFCLLQHQSFSRCNPSVSGAIGSRWSPFRNLERQIVRGGFWGQAWL